VALVAVLVQTILTLLLIAVLALFSPDVLRRAVAAAGTRPRHLTVTGLSTLAAFALTWATLSAPAPPENVTAYLRATDAAHAKDAVTAILAGFRGLDTMGEATVIAVAFLGFSTLLAGRREAS
jgi:multicomponent Na+:H+ antiporter subunit A